MPRFAARYHSAVRYLDCQTLDNTIASLAAIYGQPVDRVRQVLLSVQPDQNGSPADWPCNDGTPNDPIVTQFPRRLSAAAPIIERVYWFHRTRVADPELIKREGLRPLPEVLPYLCELVLRAAGEQHAAGLAEIRERLPHHLKARIANPGRGTDAYSVAEIGPGCGDRYLLLPEVLDEICATYLKASGHDIAEQVSATLRPYFVKFWTTPAEHDTSAALCAAWHYAYRKLHGRALGVESFTCLGYGFRPAPERIAMIPADDVPAKT